MVAANGLGQDDALEGARAYATRTASPIMRAHVEAIEDLVACTLGASPTWLPRARARCPSATVSSAWDADDYGNGSYDRFWKDGFFWCKKVIATNGEGLD